MPIKSRLLTQIIPSVETSDGAGVKLRRSLGSTADTRLDPFLLLDEFGTENPDDYIAGFPPHPHRGFETVTYMLDGHMRHEDHMGNVGELTEGGVQWMSAGRGVIHSEMPQQKEGRMRGFQLWVNLPAKEKMKPAAYRDVPAEEIPKLKLEAGWVKVIAGIFTRDGVSTHGPIQGLTTEPIYYDVSLGAGKSFQCELPATHNAFIYTYEGSVGVAGDSLPGQSVGVLSPGTGLQVEALKTPARFIVLAGKPLNESIVQHGPFVMNTRDEIEQAIRDYRAGTLVS